MWFRHGGVRYDHIKACYFGGRGTLDNCQLICIDCDTVKTRGDQKTIAKSKRLVLREQRHRERMALKGRGVSKAPRPRRWAWRVR